MKDWNDDVSKESEQEIKDIEKKRKDSLLGSVTRTVVVLKPFPMQVSVVR